MKTEQNTKTQNEVKEASSFLMKKATRYSSSLTAKRSVRPIKSMVRVKSVKPLEASMLKITK